MAPHFYENPLTGEKKTSKEWAKILGYSSYITFSNRLRVCRNKGCAQDAFLSAATRKNRKQKGKTPKTYKNPVTGEALTAVEWARKLGINDSTFRFRLHSYGANDPRCYENKKSNTGIKPGQKTSRPVTGSGDLKRLKNADRSHVLLEIPAPGTLERKYFGRVVV